MKKRAVAAALLVLALALLCAPVALYADETAESNATSTTYALMSDGSEVWIGPTQDAYLTGGVLFTEQPLTSPEDIFIRDGVLYAADTGGGRILCQRLATGERWTLGEDVLQGPTGVFVTPQGEVYVADNSAGKVLRFSAAGKLMQEYGRPTTITFGENTQYKPKSVAVDAGGILYIVSTGSYDGIIQLAPDGEFLGYFGYNAVPLSLLEQLQDLIFTEQQKQQLFNKIPLTFTNLALDDKGLCYTVTRNATDGAVKKHDISGVNLFSSEIIAAEDMVDLTVGPDGQVFAVSESGMVYEYNNAGELLFIFGGQAASSERRGLFTLASSIAVDEHCNLYVLDKERGVVHTFVPAEYASALHEAIRTYQGGGYEQSLGLLQALLQRSGDAAMIHNYLGNNYLQLHNFEAAAESYRRGGNHAGYSEAFWELRNNAIQRGFSVVLVCAIAVGLVVFVLHRVRPKRKVQAGATPESALPQREKRAFVRELRYALYFFKHPFDGYYEVKCGHRGSVGAASVLYLLAFLAFALHYLGQGFAFSGRSPANTSPIYVLMLFTLPVGLFVLCSYMVSEINNGEGSLKKMYIGMAYAFVPMICLLPVFTLLTHVLALTEVFIISFGTVLVVAWVGVLLFLAIREIHNYEFRQVFLNILLTLFLMIVMIFVFSIIGMFWDRVLDMLASIAREVAYRAFG